MERQVNGESRTLVYVNGGVCKKNNYSFNTLQRSLIKFQTKRRLYQSNNTYIKIVLLHSEKQWYAQFDFNVLKIIVSRTK